MKSGGSLPRWAKGKTYFESILKNQMKGLDGAWSLFLFSYFLRGGGHSSSFPGRRPSPQFSMGGPCPTHNAHLALSLKGKTSYIQIDSIDGKVEYYSQYISILTSQVSVQFLCTTKLLIIA